MINLDHLLPWAKAYRTENEIREVLTKEGFNEFLITIVVQYWGTTPVIERMNVRVTKRTFGPLSHIIIFEDLLHNWSEGEKVYIEDKEVQDWHSYYAMHILLKSRPEQEGGKQ